jgi:hypothetical protein
MRFVVQLLRNGGLISNRVPDEDAKDLLRRWLQHSS